MDVNAAPIFIDVHRQFTKAINSWPDETPMQKLHVEWMFFPSGWPLLSRAPASHIHTPINSRVPKRKEEKRAGGPRGAGSVWAQHPAAWRASPPSDAEEACICGRQRGLQLFHRGWLSCPRVEGRKCEASDGDQADNVSNEALCVIGLHGAGEKLTLLRRLGGCKGRPELPKSMGLAVLRIFRS